MIGDSIGKGRQAKLQLRAAKKAQTQARDSQERAVWMAQEQDWNPEYASDHIGPYQRSQSPIADAWLDSLLTGDNQSAVQGTRAGAQFEKADAGQRFNQNYGGWDALRQKQREVEAATPWAVTPTTRQVSQPDVSRYAWDAHKAGGLSLDELKQLERDGFQFNDKGQFVWSKSGIGAQLAMGEGYAAPTKPESIKQIFWGKPPSWTSADSGEGRAYMRGLSRARMEGRTLDEAVGLGRDELIRRGANPNQQTQVR